MRAYVSAFWLQKSGSSPAEYEDAYSLPINGDDGNISSDHCRVVIADGATESLLARQWASRLVAACANPDAEVDAALQKARGDWSSVVAEYADLRLAQGRPVQWYEEPGLARGAFATLLALDVRAADDTDDCEAGTYQAFAVGDACLFHVRQQPGVGGTPAIEFAPRQSEDAGGLLSSFPCSRSIDFDCTPDLVRSKGPDAEAMQGLVATAGSWQTGDTLYLATDAFSQWIFSQTEDGRPPWSTLRDLGTMDSTEPFERWIADLRASGEMRNDDVTIVRVTFW